MGSHSEPRSLADNPDATEGKSEDKIFLFGKHTGTESGERASGELFVVQPFLRAGQRDLVRQQSQCNTGWAGRLF